jgi:hypothetical protein
MTAGPSDAELAKLYWKRQAQQLKAQIEEADPTMKSTTGAATGVKPWKPVQDAAVAGASTKAFIQAFNGNNETSVTPKVSPSEVAAAKGRIIEAMVQAGRDTRYIEDAMMKISPHLDIFALSSDPAVQSVLLQRIMSGGASGGQNFGMRDLIEAVKLVNDVRAPQQSQSDPGSLMTAATNAVRIGAELGSSKNNSSDPLAMMKMITDNQAQSHAQQLQMYERLLDSQQPRSLREQLTDLREVTDTLGKISGKEPTEIQMKRLDILAQREQRQFESSIELQKGKQQSAMFENIAGALGKALESPILKEAGRKMAESIPGLGKTAGAVSQVQSNAARSTLDQPLDEVFAFTCQQCGTTHQFSRKALTLIDSSPTRMWACPKCGASYRLGQQVGGAGTAPSDDKKDQPPTVAP